MVKIRLTRMGAKKRPFYRVVAINSDERRDGRPLDFLGNYNPHTNPPTFNCNMEKVQQFVKNGAILSDKVRALIKRMGNNK